jgi:hypothetical protein
MRLGFVCIAAFATFSLVSGFVAIANNETVFGSVSKDEAAEYTYVASGPNKAIRFVAEPSSGDVDLEVVWGADNTIAWTSGLVGADQVVYVPPKAGGLCNGANPATCTFVVRVLGFTASAEFSLLVEEFTAPAEGPITIPPLPTLPPSGASGFLESEDQMAYIITPPIGGYSLFVNATGYGEADVDLYVSTLSNSFKWGSFNVGPDSIQFNSSHPYACTRGAVPCAYVVFVYNAGAAGGDFAVNAVFNSVPGSDCNPARFVPGVYRFVNTDHPLCMPANISLAVFVSV